MEPYNQELLEIRIAIAKLEEHQKTNFSKLDALLDKIENAPSSKDMARLEKRVDIIETDIESIHTMTNKWKGGLILLVAVGSILGWFGSVVGNISKLWSGH